jgi:hypothetical protein
MEGKYVYIKSSLSNHDSWSGQETLSLGHMQDNITESHQ